jgi:hypothetical protein
MQDTAYHVILFRRHESDLIGLAPIEAESAIAAVGEAQRLAQEVAGAIVIGRLIDSGTGKFEAMEIVFRTGDVPDALPDFAATGTAVSVP